MKDIETIKERAKKGDMQSQVELAHAYLNGEGTVKNRGLYLKWLENAAHQGHLESQLELVDFYCNTLKKYADPVKAAPRERKGVSQWHYTQLAICTCVLARQSQWISSAAPG